MPELARLMRSERGQGITEYVVIVVLVALCVVFVVSRYGGGIRRKVDTAASHVENADKAAKTGAAKGPAPTDGGSAQGAASSSGAAATVGRSSSGSASVLGPERMGSLAAEEEESEGLEVLGFTIDLKTAISLAVLIIVIGVVMVARVSKGLKKKEPRPKKSEA